MNSTVHTLCDTTASDPALRHLRGLLSADLPASDVCTTVEARNHTSHCDAPKCRKQADYYVPQGLTPRSWNRQLSFCIDCLEVYLRNLSTSIVLEGEPCEWELTMTHLRNVYDGGHDWRRNLLQESCEHQACQAKRRGALELAQADAEEGGAVISEEAAHAS